MSQRRLRSPLAAIALAAAILALSAAPAWAHNQVIDTAPGEGTTVETAIGAVVLRVDHPPLEPLADSSSIEVVAPGGEVVSGEITADAPQRLVEPIPVLLQEDGEWVQDYHFEAYPLRVPLSSLPEAGEYAVTYSVADSDGHPTEGSFTFAYAGPTGPVPAGAADPVTGPTLVTTASAEEAAAAGVTPDGDQDDSSTTDAGAEDAPAPSAAAATDDDRSAVPVAAAAAGLVVAAGALLVWRRRRAAAAPTGAARTTPPRSARARSGARSASARRSPSAKRPASAKRGR